LFDDQQDLRAADIQLFYTALREGIARGLAGGPS
jgi:hypothetical protein